VDGLSPVSVRNVLAVLRAVLGEAVQQELLPANPARSLTPPRPRRVRRQGLEISEVEELIRSLPERWSLLVETAAYTGLRAGELAGLKVEQLDLRRGQPPGNAHGGRREGRAAEDTPKTEAGHRTVTGLSTALCARLAAYVAAQGLGSADYLFGPVRPAVPAQQLLPVRLPTGLCPAWPRPRQLPRLAQVARRAPRVKREAGADA
jgi:integrase